MTLARIVRPQGRKGELLAELLTDFPERFEERRRLFLLSAEKGRSIAREVWLEEHWLHKDRLVLKLKGIDSIEAAEALRDQDVVIPLAERAPLEDDAVYIGDLAGCALYDRVTGRVVGEIVDVDRESSSLALIVVRPLQLATDSGTKAGAKTKTPDELLIPFAKAYLPQIDLATRRMEMSLPEGLLALNEPLTAEESRLAAEAQADLGQTAAVAPRRRR